jgi:hypothetical protein
MKNTVISLHFKYILVILTENAIFDSGYARL